KKKTDGQPFYFVEVLEPVRKYINPDKPQDAAALEALVSTGETISQLTLHQRNLSLVFSAADLD
ncbi:hypothetical protein, partial [Acinetobacter baumannii]